MQSGASPFYHDVQIRFQRRANDQTEFGGANFERPQHNDIRCHVHVSANLPTAVQHRIRENEGNPILRDRISKVPC